MCLSFYCCHHFRIENKSIKMFFFASYSLHANCLTNLFLFFFSKIKPTHISRPSQYFVSWLIVSICICRDGDVIEKQNETDLPSVYYAECTLPVGDLFGGCAMRAQHTRSKMFSFFFVNTFDNWKIDLNRAKWRYVLCIWHKKKSATHTSLTFFIPFLSSHMLLFWHRFKAYFSCLASILFVL